MITRDALASQLEHLCRLFHAQSGRVPQLDHLHFADQKRQKYPTVSAVSICAPEPSRVLNAVIAGPLKVERSAAVLLVCTLGVVADAIARPGVSVCTAGLALTSVSTAFGLTCSRKSTRRPWRRERSCVNPPPTADVWVQDLARGTITRLTSDGDNVQPIWTPDGKRVVFAKNTRGVRTPFWVPADGSGEPEQMFKGDHQGGAGSFSPDGQLVAFLRRAPDTGLDIWVQPLQGTPQPFLRTRFTEVGPRFSPDGRWISYVSDESGRYEVYVRPYPGPGGKWQISTQGGEGHIWSRDGRELFYRNGNKWMVVAVDLQPVFKAETPRLLFEGPYVQVGGASYDVTPDGQRFLLLEPAEQVGPIIHLNVVLNWFEEVKQKAGRLR